MKVKELIAKLQRLHPEATVLRAMDGYSTEVEQVEPIAGVYQVMCEVGPGMWQRCMVEETTCNRKQSKGVLLV